MLNTFLHTILHKKLTIFLHKFSIMLRKQTWDAQENVYTMIKNIIYNSKVVF